MNNFDKMVDRYAQGSVPWDDELPPPEVMEMVRTLSPGRALDLGCGYGRSSIYLAQHGWQVDGIDFVPQAVSMATLRAHHAGIADQINFYNESVSKLDFLTNSYDFALDVGCMHALNESDLLAYASHLRRLLRLDAVYLLFARLRQPDWDTDDGPSGLPETQIHALFSEGFKLEKLVRGETIVEDHSVWASGWFYYRRS